MHTTYYFHVHRLQRYIDPLHYTTQHFKVIPGSQKNGSFQGKKCRVWKLGNLDKDSLGSADGNLDWFAVTSASSYLLKRKKKKEKQNARWPRTVQPPSIISAMQRPFMKKRRGRREKLGKIKAMYTPTWIAERKKKKKGKIKWEPL